ncbi:MAG: FGGY-family carbohydrate kinase [Desulfurococcaceae archaeon]
MSCLVNKNLIIDAKALLSTWFLGYPITDLSTASGTYQMLNISTLKWDSTILEIASLSEDQLPELREAYYLDYICEKTANETSLLAKTPYIVGLYDGGSMIYGLSLGESNIGVVNLGTSGMLRVIVDKPIVDSSPYMRFQTYYLMDRDWLSGGGINNAGIVLEFLVKLLGLDYNKIDTTLSQDPISSRSIPLVIPLLYKERINIPLARTGISIFGISPETTIDHIIWGAVEGILMLIKLVEEALLENSINFDIVKLRGGLTKYKGVVEALSSVLNKRTYMLSHFEASHIGCALIALGVLEGRRRLKDITHKLHGLMEYVDPKIDLVQYYAEKYRGFKNTIFGAYN